MSTDNDTCLDNPHTLYTGQKFYCDTRRLWVQMAGTITHCNCGEVIRRAPAPDDDATTIEETIADLGYSRNRMSAASNRAQCLFTSTRLNSTRLLIPG